MTIRNSHIRTLLRKLVRSGMSRMDAARTAGVGYDCATRWTCDLPKDKPTGKGQLTTDEDYEPLPATEPTAEPIGSVGRINAYRERAERGEVLHHKQDSMEMERLDDRQMQVLRRHG